LSDLQKESLDDILSDLASLRKVRKDNKKYLEICKSIGQKVEGTLTDSSAGLFSLDNTDKIVLRQIYDELLAEESYANASSSLRDISNLERLFRNE